MTKLLLLFFVLGVFSGCSYLEQNAKRNIPPNLEALKKETAHTTTDASNRTLNLDDGRHNFDHLPPKDNTKYSDNHTGNPNDIWTRIRSGYQIDISNNNRRVRKHRRWYIKHDTYLNQVLTRSEPYLHHIVEEIDKRNLPMELALLPVIESAYDPFAVSRSKAAGLWQFIPKTGKGFGLKQNWWYDGRQDVIASTDAALTYLQQLHKRFDDWELALASYNAGQGTVARAIKKSTKRRKHHLPSFWNLKLSDETTNYVPKFIAIAQIIKNPKQYRIQLPPIANQPQFITAQLPHQVDLSHISEVLDVKPENLLKLNPGFKRGFSDPRGPHRFLTPIHKANALQAALPQLRAKKQFASWAPYKIKSGDTLSQIARRHNTNVKSLQKFNRLNTHFIRKGQTILVPKSITQPTLQSKSIAQTQNSAPHPKTASLSNTPLTKNVAATKNAQAHVVVPGDTLWGISRQYQVPIKQIKKLNPETDNRSLKIGEKIQLIAISPHAQIATNQYQVQPGDSLYRIAKQFSVSIPTLMTANNLAEQTILMPGQMLNVPTKSP